jgi:hypothetical protein
LDDSEQVDAAHSVAADGAIASVALEESVGEDDDAATEEPKLSVDLMTAFLGPLAGEVECYEEDEQIYVATDDSDASCFPPPAERQPRKKQPHAIEFGASLFRGHYSCVASTERG